MEPAGVTPRHGLGSLLLLADGRLPTGAHAHSGGIEPAVADGRVRDHETLLAYLLGRLATAGAVDAGLAAAAADWAGTVADAGDPDAREGAVTLEAEANARVPSAALRRASRAQGRGLLRVASRAWPSAALEVLAGVHPDGPPWPLALGAAGVAAEVGAEGVAVVARWAAVSGPAWAAVRLLGLDPLSVAALLAGLAPMVESATGPNPAEAARVDGSPPGQGATGGSSGVRRARPGEETPSARSLRDLPATSGLLVELAADAHARWEVRLFAS